MAARLLKEKSERDKSGNPVWNLDRSDDHLAVVRRIFPGNIYSSDAITDHVVEPVRISCHERSSKGGNLASQKEAWEKLLLDAKSGGEQIPTTAEDAHEMVYQIARGCNLFNISLGIYLLTGEKNNKTWGPIEALNGSPGDVLDPAAGWGDRLGASFISGAKSYRGWDTNDKLQPVYAELANKYKEVGLNLDWDIQNAPFETADLKGAMFDTVITSPPFFDKEIYEGASTSTSVHRGKKQWIDNYYHPMLLKAGGSLRTGGRFIAYISEGWMVNEAKVILEGKLKMKYVGRVGFVQTMQDKVVEPWQVRNSYIWRVAGGEPVVASAGKMDYYGAGVYLRLMKATEGKAKSAGGYNISDLLELVKYHKPDALPKEVNRANLLEILKGVREVIRLGGPALPLTPLNPLATLTESSQEIVLDRSIPEPTPDPTEVEVEEVTTGVKLDDPKMFDYKIERLEARHRTGVKKLTGDPDTMKNVGTGRTWDDRKLDDLFKYAKQDKGKISKYVSYVIITDGDVRGMLQFHPSAANNNLAVDPQDRNDVRLYLTIFIHPDYQRKGLAERSIRQAIDELRRERGNTLAFGAHVSATNKASLALHKKLNFKIEAIDRIGLREFIALSLPPPLPEVAKGTYILDLENLEFPAQQTMLNAFKLRRITLDKAVEIGGCEQVIMHGAMEEDKRLWKVVTYLRSSIDAEIITNKGWLSESMKGINIRGSQPVVAKSDRLKGVTSVPVFNDEKGNPLAWIWRPEEDNRKTDGLVGLGGKGIVIGRGPEDLKALLVDNKRLTGLLTRFEENPMLLAWRLRDFPHHPSYSDTSAALDVVEMRKFHLRVYVVIITDRYGKRMGLYNSGHFICFADKGYNKDDLKDLDIHNTRFSGNNGKPFPEAWPSDATVTAADIMSQMVDLFKAVAIKCMPNVRPYAESHYGFEILGCDVMINSSGKAWIVEMNKNPDTGGTPGVLKRIADALYGGLYSPDEGYLGNIHDKLVSGSTSFITEVWREALVPSVPVPKKSLSLADKGAKVSVKEKRSNIATYHSQVKYYFLNNIKFIIKNSMDPKGKMRILDLACGRGGDLFKYLDTFGKDTYINGVDIDAGAIVEAKRRVKAKGISNITLSVADVSNPDLDTSKWGGAYDIIVCNFAAHYFFRSREALDSFTRLLNRYSKKDTIIWIIMPNGIRLVKLLLEQGKRAGSKVSIDNEVYTLSSTIEEMSKVGGRVDYKLHGTTYFQTAEPGADIITEGTSHEYFADIDTLFESLSITAEPPVKYTHDGSGKVNKRFLTNGVAHFSQFPFIEHVLTPKEQEISYTNVNIILRCIADPAEKPTRDGKPIPEKELNTYWRDKEKGLGKDLPYVRTEPVEWWRESDKQVFKNLKAIKAVSA
jgi:RimJ/RimL family protein N-acetyltransferase/SAM-dependent methyltransferase